MDHVWPKVFLLELGAEVDGRSTAALVRITVLLCRNEVQLGDEEKVG